MVPGRYARPLPILNKRPAKTINSPLNFLFAHSPALWSIVHTHLNGTYDVRFDDGDSRTLVPSASVCLCPTGSQLSRSPFLASS